MRNYLVYLGFLNAVFQEATLHMFRRLGWFPEEDSNNAECWFLTVPDGDESIFWCLEDSGIMEVWEG